MILSPNRADSRLTDRRRKGGILTAELIFLIPIALIFFVGILEIGTLILARHRLEIASWEGARVGALNTDPNNPNTEANRDLIYTAVVGGLGGGPITLANVDIVYYSEDDNGNPDPTTNSAEFVEVTVYASVGLIMSASPSLITRAFKDQVMIGKTVMRIQP